MLVGFDLGGTKLATIALDEQGRELGRTRQPVPRSYPETVATLAASVAALERVHGAAASIGIALPGMIGADGRALRVVNLPWLEHEPLAADLAAQAGCPVAVANDANCFALSEAVDGAGAGASVLFGAILGTGVGGGIVIDGRVLAGSNAIAGEWGHNVLPALPDDPTPAPPRCACGRLGCTEAWLGGAGLSRSHRQAGGPEAGAAEIAARADAGEPAARTALMWYERRLALALATIVNILDPEVIVLGGGLSQIERLYDAVPLLWGAYTVTAQPATRLAKARHGPDSGLRGAAWLGAQAAQKKVRMPSITR
jgi:fructokinase